LFGIGFPELALIMVVALIVFGPEKLPEMAKTIGNLMGQLRKSSDSVRREFYNNVYTPAKDIRGQVDGKKRQLRSFKDSVKKELTSSPDSEKEKTAPPVKDNSESNSKADKHAIDKDEVKKDE